MNRQLERWSGLGLCVLVALMPIHAFCSVWLGSLLGHEALMQAWKEALLLVLACMAASLVWLEPARIQRLRQPWVLLAGGFALVAALVTLAARPPLTAMILGAKTDLEFLLAAIIAALVATPQLIRRLTVIILAGATVVVAIGLSQAYLLPPDFFRHFGYGPSTIVPYEHILAGVSALRFPSTLGGPNQLGTYLILPLSLSLAVAIRRRWWWLLALTGGALLVLFGTYSRSAWIGAFVALAITLVVEVPRRLQTQAALGIAGLVVLICASIPILSRSPTLRYVVLHSPSETVQAGSSLPSSDLEHAQSLKASVGANTQSPLGHGLGTAGPATFHSGTGNIIENYYLQLGYETGLLGALLFVALTIALVIRLAGVGLSPLLAAPTAAALVGISLVALVLPAWTDSSTALITWTAAGALTGLKAKTDV